MFMAVLPVWTFVCHMHAVLTETRRGHQVPRKLQSFVSSHMGARNQILQVFLTLAFPAF